MWLVGIGLYHALLTLVVMLALYLTNVSDAATLSFSDGDRHLWINAAMLGFLGSLLYFSRKTYVYLITDKLYRLEAEATKDTQASGNSLGATKDERYRTRLIGYYVYLIIRPFAGIAIGPMSAMIILGGLTTLSKNSSVSGSALSQTGIYVVYLFSFVGGYTSSDMFDYLSKLGGRLVAKAKFD
jgi:hypothetical protein